MRKNGRGGIKGDFSYLVFKPVMLGYDQGCTKVESSCWEELGIRNREGGDAKLRGEYLFIYSICVL